MQAITTKFGAVNQRGAKVTATSSSGLRATVERWTEEYSSNEDKDASRRAVFALCRRLGWTGTLVEGETRRGFLYVFWEPIGQTPVTFVRILDSHGKALASSGD